MQPAVSTKNSQKEGLRKVARTRLSEPADLAQLPRMAGCASDVSDPFPDGAAMPKSGSMQEIPMQTGSEASSGRPEQGAVNVTLHGIPPLLRYALSSAICEFAEPRNVHMYDQVCRDEPPEGMDEPHVAVVLAAAHRENTLTEMKQAADQHPAAQLLVLALKPDDDEAVRLIRSGARGYLSIGEEPGEFVCAISAVAGGSVFVSPSLQASVALRYLGPDAEGPEDDLTVRERAVLRLLAEGIRHEDIASILCVGVRTVDTHRTNLMRKLGLRSNVELVHFAIRHRLIHL
jgi:DNA-binding NarL/FixJ family response regulator